jgi:hypothetical protein
LRLGGNGREHEQRGRGDAFDERWHGGFPPKIIFFQFLRKLTKAPPGSSNALLAAAPFALI